MINKIMITTVSRTKKMLCGPVWHRYLSRLTTPGGGLSMSSFSSRLSFRMVTTGTQHVAFNELTETTLGPAA